MQNNSYNLATLLISNPLAWIYVRLMPSAPAHFPRTIGDYQFVRPIKKIGPRASYKLALYRRGTSNKYAFAKMTSAAQRGYHYYSLKNEMNAYDILNNVIRRIGTRMPARFKKLYIPAFICAYEDSSSLISLVEYTPGRTTEHVDTNQKIALYTMMLDFIKYLGDHMTQAESSTFSSRSSIQYLGLFPLLVIKAIITNPRGTSSILQGALAYVTLVPTVISHSRMGLVHRDLHFMNILKISGGRYALIDFQQMVMTEPLHESLTTIRYWWDTKQNPDFARRLLAYVIKRESGRDSLVPLLRAYGINSCIHGLTGPGFSHEIIDGWIAFLKVCIRGDFARYSLS